MLGREKGKEPLVLDEEFDWDWVYVFEEMWDIFEMDLCDNCGECIEQGGECPC